MIAQKRRCTAGAPLPEVLAAGVPDSVRLDAPPGTRTSPGRGVRGPPTNPYRDVSSNLDIGDLATGGEIGLMPHEHSIRIRIDGEQPPITVGAEVNLSGSDHHANCSMPLLLKSN
jgi:hypothetical protein